MDIVSEASTEVASAEASAVLVASSPSEVSTAVSVAVSAAVSVAVSEATSVAVSVADSVAVSVAMDSVAISSGSAVMLCALSYDCSVYKGTVVSGFSSLEQLSCKLTSFEAAFARFFEFLTDSGDLLSSQLLPPTVTRFLPTSTPLKPRSALLSEPSAPNMEPKSPATLESNPIWRPLLRSMAPPKLLNTDENWLMTMVWTSTSQICCKMTLESRRENQSNYSSQSGRKWKDRGEYSLLSDFN